MKKVHQLFLVGFFLMSMMACRTSQHLSNQTSTTDEVIYRQAIQDAMYATAPKVCSTLVKIDKSNKDLTWKTIDGEDYLLVVTWKQNVSYYEPYLDSSFYNTGKYPIWITTAPELKNRIQKEQPTNINRRLVQLLGLPPNATYSYFVEFWVRPQDLFRPCLDPEINDASCDLCFPANTEPSHINWINKSRIDRYYPCELYQQYPWTQLGYTYDWHPKNKSHVGLSEFVIGKNKNLVVHAIYTTEEYLKK